MFKKNTAARIYFVLVNASTGEPLTGATVTASVTKDGGAQGAAAGAVSELGNGQYVLAATAVDMNADHLGFLFTAAGAVPVSLSIATTTKRVSELNDLSAAQVNAEADTAISDAALATASSLAAVNTIVDAIKAKTDNLPAEPAAVGSEMTLANGAITDAKIASNALTGAKLDATAIQKVWDALTSALTTPGSIGKYIVDNPGGGGGLSLSDTVGTNPAANTVEMALRTVLSNLDAAISSVGGAVGAGSIAHTITFNDGTNPIDGVSVWISTDPAGSNIVAGALFTNASGQVTFMLDAGTYYAHAQKSGYNFTPQVFTVTP